MLVSVPQEPAASVDDAVVVQLESYALVGDFLGWLYNENRAGRHLHSYQCGSSGLGKLFMVFPAEFKDRINDFLDKWEPHDHSE